MPRGRKMFATWTANIWKANPCHSICYSRTHLKTPSHKAIVHQSEQPGFATTGRAASELVISRFFTESAGLGGGTCRLGTAFCQSCTRFLHHCARSCPMVPQFVGQHNFLSATDRSSWMETMRNRCQPRVGGRDTTDSRRLNRR